ncbi:MAG: tol-pal system protein YbgF, partial [Rhodospirillales bacterium RIFCSPLOWO2_02_FULL_58_16]
TLGGAPQASAQSGDVQSLIDRINRLEQDIRTLNIQLSRGGTPGKDAVLLSSGSATTHLEDRLTIFEEELRAVTGKIEDLSYKIDQVGRRLDKMVGDVDYRLGSLEKSRGTPAAQDEAAQNDAAQASAPPKVSAAPTPPSVQTGEAPGTLGASGGKAAPPAAEKSQQSASTGKSMPKGTPQERYDRAFDLLRQSKYDDAAAALREFLETGGDDPLAGNANYWLGETYYVREDFRTAAQVFIEGYQKYPKSAKASDTLLKLGMSLAKIDKKNEACTTFAKLLSDFPKMSDALGKRVAKERQANGCK